MLRFVVAALVSITVAACSNVGKLTYGTQELRAEIHRRAPNLASKDIIVPFEIAPEYLAKLKRQISPYMGPSERAQALLKAMFDPGVFGLTYRETVTRTANETIETKGGNCLSLAAVFVGFARALNLRAYFMDASSRVQETREDADMLILTGHITAVVETERGRVAMDFGRRLSPFRIYRVMDDVEAIAHFYNNLGYELISASRGANVDIPWDKVAQKFKMAIMVKHDFARAWNNLGVAKVRMGLDKEARTAYETAASLDKQFSSPLVNLGILLMKRNEPGEAMRVFQRVLKMDPDNPRINLFFALALWDLKKCHQAKKAIKRVLELDPGMRRARELLKKQCQNLGQKMEEKIPGTDLK